MAGFEQIEEVLRRAARRRRWQRAWRGLWWGLLAGGLCWVLVLGLYKVLPLPMLPTLSWGGVVAALLPVAGFVIGFSRREDPLLTARWLDLQQGLKERLSTAVELQTRARDDSWGQLVVADARRHLERLNLRQLLPWHLPPVWRHVLLVLALGAGLGFVPEYRSEAYREAQREKAVVKEAGQRLAEITRRSLDRRKPELESTRKSLEAVEQLGKKLARRPLTRDEALRELAKLTEDVGKKLDALDKKPAMKSLERAARSDATRSPSAAEALQKQIEALQKQMGGKPPQADALQKLSDALRKAQQAAAAMGKHSEGREAAKADLAQALAQMARQARQMGASLPSLEAALAALKAGQIDQMLKDLDAVSEDLQEQLNMAKALQQMQQQSAQIGKNLKEQLERGQAALAAQRLRQMARKLQSGQMTPEELRKMMQELSQAIDPAGQYGKVQDRLKKGLKRMQSRQPGEAGKQLAAAANELEKLMQQMADAQSLQAALGALKKAQMCVGNCQSWGMCKTPGQPRFKPGAKPGQGVGTWGDDSLTMTPQNSGRWDNSGVQRPDMDPRGLTDRGDGTARDDLMPTRIKGQFKPGGPMPSITLKGVSIKGQSRAALQEAVTAAQSEAQSALSQDIIPRAYQGTVRDYFDDLKE